MSTIHTHERIPSVPHPPILGWRGMAIDFARDSVKFLTKLHQEHGKIVHLGQGKMSATFTFHPEYTRQILSNPSLFYSFSLEDVPVPFSNIDVLKSMTTAIALLNGEQHKRHRHLMAPAFHNHVLPAYRSQIQEVVDRYFSKWKDGQEIDVYREMDLFTNLLAMKVFVGMESDEESTRFAGLFEVVLKLLFNPTTFLLPYDLPGFPYHRLRMKGVELESNLRELIRRRVEMGPGGTDTLSLFLEARDNDGLGLREEEIIGETVAVFRGGSKTSASVLTWTLFLLTQHPDVYANLTDELAGTLRGSQPSLEHLSQLPLLEGVIKESMRVIPPVLWGIRYSVDDFEFDGIPQPKGSSVLYSSYVTHHMPEIFEQPQKFIPYRWETIRPSAYEYFPFNAGPRRCLGAEFAMMEMKIALATLLQEYHFALMPHQRIDRVGLTGSLPKHGIRMKLGVRGGSFTKIPVRGNVHKVVDLN